MFMFLAISVYSTVIKIVRKAEGSWLSNLLLLTLIQVSLI